MPGTVQDGQAINSGCDMQAVVTGRKVGAWRVPLPAADGSLWGHQAPYCSGAAKFGTIDHCAPARCPSGSTVPWRRPGPGPGSPAHPERSWAHWSSAFASWSATHIACAVRAKWADSLATWPCGCGQRRRGGPEPSRWWNGGPDC
jgi:hypothetical protein